MEFTFDHFIFLFGISFGVVLALISTLSIEWIKNRKNKKRIINALYCEARVNIKKAQVNLELSEKIKSKPTSFVPFHTVAYEQYKLGMMIDEKEIPNIINDLVNAYTVAELFNRRISVHETQRDSKNEEKFFRTIEKLMMDIFKKLSPYVKDDKP